jgi:ferredoxin--NADP+ reductase
MTGPAGSIMLLPEDHLQRDIVCVSTGTGIAPFRSFWRRLFYDGLPGGPAYTGKFSLYSGFANEDSVLYGESMRRGSLHARAQHY